MTPELIGIGIIIVGITAAAFYFLHTAKGKAEAATLEANLKGHLTQVASDIKDHVTQTAANNAPVPAAPPAPAAAPAPPSPAVAISIPAPVIPQVSATVPAPSPVDPRTIPGGTTGYNSANYPTRGTTEGMNAWAAAGSPYKDVNGIVLDNTGWAPPGSAPAAAPTCPWPPGAQWQVDVNNGVTVTSTSFTPPAGTYRVDATDGLSQGYASATWNGAPVVIGNPFNHPADTPVVMTMTASPGNPNSSQTRMGCQVHPA